MRSHFKEAAKLMQIKAYLGGGELIAPSPVYFISPFENPSVKLHHRQMCPPPQDNREILLPQ